MTYMKLVVFFLLLFFLSACTALKTTNRLYYKYINPSPKLNLKNKGLSQSLEHRFSQAIMPVDGPLASLLEEMSAHDYRPTSNELEQLLFQYPWLHSVGILAPTGDLAEMAGNDFKANPALILDMETPQKRSLQLLEGKDGYLILLYPIYIENIWEGFKMACFHPQKLMNQSPQANHLAFFINEASLYHGINFSAPDAISHKLQTEPAIHRQFENKGKSYCWLRRKLGNHWLTYVYMQGS